MMLWMKSHLLETIATTNHKLTNINFITLNTQAAKDNQVITQSYVDRFHKDNEGSKGDVGLNFYNESSGSLKYNQDNAFND